MGQSSKPAVPALLAALKDNNEDVRYYAVLALLRSGIKLPEVLPGIIVGLKDQKHVHKPIFEYLEALGPEAKEAVPALIAAFGTNSGDRASIARILGSIGPAAKKALPTLIDFLQHPEAGAEAQKAVQDALKKINK
jgi:HEAT repeat protein